MKDQYAADLKAGDRVAGIYHVHAAAARSTMAGRRYLAVVLADRSGQIDARYWGAPERLGRQPEAGDLLRIEGSVESYRGGLQVNIRRADPVPVATVDPADFLPSSYRDTDELRGFLLYFITEVYDADYRALLESFFHDEAFMDRFCVAPGESRSHHAYLGGLLEHTVSVATLCQHLVVQHPRLDGDLLVAAALLHDIGKVREFECGTAIGLSREGRLLGHVLLGQRMIEERMRRLGGFPREKELLLAHALISHHGELEWGAPKRPQSAEALALHHIDNLDAKVKGFFEVVAGSGGVSWPELMNLFRRPLDMPQAADRSGAASG